MGSQNKFSQGLKDHRTRPRRTRDHHPSGPSLRHPRRPLPQIRQPVLRPRHAHEVRRRLRLARDQPRGDLPRGVRRGGRRGGAPHGVLPGARPGHVLWGERRGGGGRGGGRGAEGAAGEAQGGDAQGDEEERCRPCGCARSERRKT
uniref:Uncharacterized protein n=1 Tax=Arcella intermedia TaxID=1963864 RepID=A0A6B2LM39_9EUKA